MDLNRDIFIKLTVPKRWKNNLEDENLLVSLKCTAALFDPLKKRLCESKA